MSKSSIIKSSVFSKKSLKKLLTEKSPFGVKESYGAIRTQLMFSKKNEKCPVFAITSTTAGDGKTLTCVNLAISFAQLNKKVLVIDGDMRNPTIHKMFSLSCHNGLSELLAGFSDSINFKASGVENLTILTAGEIPPNPAELLSSEQFDKLIRLCKEHFDYVFIDTPPAGMVNDTFALAQKVTGFVVIVRAGSTDVRDLTAIVDSMKGLGATVSGFICNDSDGKLRSQKSSYSKGYYKKIYYKQRYQYAADRTADNGSRK